MVVANDVRAYGRLLNQFIRDQPDGSISVLEKMEHMATHAPRLFQRTYRIDAQDFLRQNPRQ